MRRATLVSSLLALPLLLPGCAAGPPSAKNGPPAGPQLALGDFLLQLTDRRDFQKLIFDNALVGPPATREALAVALGRIGDRRGVDLAAALAVDGEVEVRRAAVFALGEIGDAAGLPALRTALTDLDREVGVLAVEALGKCGEALGQVLPRLAPLGEAERRARLLPHLFRFRETATVEAASAALDEADPELRRAAVYALARYPRPEAVPRLRSLLADGDAAVRALAARGLAEVGGEEDLESLLPLASGSDPSAAVQALRAAARLFARAPAPLPLWGEVLLRRLDDAAIGVRATAVEVAGTLGPGLLPPTDARAVEALLAARAASAETLRERELALLSLARLGATAIGDRLADAARAEEPVLRAAAATAAGRLADDELLARLLADASARVRVAALEARLARPQPAAAAQRALADSDPAVRATALDWLAGQPQASVEELVAALAASRRDPFSEPQVSAVQALAARAAAVEAERAPALAVLDRLALDENWLVAREARQALARLGGAPPAARPLSTGKSRTAYAEALSATGETQFAELVTARGTLRLRLDCPQAPLTCLSFLQLARAGYFDGLTFHRVVPDFVVQGGDPRGDGWGGPGYALRDEINRLRYRRGVVGMALSGPDTGGSQFFITLSPQPHLDGGYTVFGEVVAGDAVLDRLVQGDRIERVVVVESR